MNFDPPLIEGTLLRRYKRFLADVALNDGSELTVHCPNPGAMTGLNEPGNKVWISDSQNPKRKLRHTLELMKVGATMVGINTNRANGLAREAIDSNMIPGVCTQDKVLPEQKYGENSRIDFLIERKSAPLLYLEVKNVHFVRQKGLHEFPDGVTARGSKHLRELMQMVDQGHEAMMLYIVQRNDGEQFKIADDIDRVYGETFDLARKHGVKAHALTCNVTTNAITPLHSIKVL